MRASVEVLADTTKPVITAVALHNKTSFSLGFGLTLLTEAVVAGARTCVRVQRNELTQEQAMREMEMTLSKALLTFCAPRFFLLAT